MLCVGISGGGGGGGGSKTREKSIFFKKGKTVNFWNSIG